MSSKTKTTTTTEGATPALVPKLRFPEFLEAEGWNTTPGDELFEQINNRQAPAGLPILAITQEHGAIPRDLIDYHVSVTDKSVETYKEVRPGDFVISLRSFQGGIEYSDYHGICSPAYVILRKRAELPDLFFKQHFKSHSFIQQLTKNLEGLRDGKMVSYKQFSELLLLNPSPPEQQKIAECLGSVDELMAAQARKVDALKTHKKGLMQQLFPREGETQPRLRFPEFQNAGEWEKTTIGALGNFYYGKSAPKWSLEDEAPTPCVRYGELYTKFGPIITETYSRTNIDPTTLRFSKGGEILVPRVGEKPEDFGKCCCYLPLKGVAIGEMISVFETEQHPLFYTYYFRHLYRQFARVVEGQNVKNLYYAVLQPLVIYRPPLPEQQRIAACLSSLDALIAAETQKLEALKTHKKGLMQQLFPSPVELEP